jgi:8-oxo-dGTP diphosphatase
MDKSKQRFHLMPGVCLIIKKEDKYLLLKRKNSQWYDGYYGLLGGGVDGGETVRQTMVREAYEEIGIKVNENDLKMLYVMHLKGVYKPEQESIVFYAQVEKWEGEPKIMEPHKCTDMQWFTVEEMPENTIPAMHKVLDDVNNGIFYGELGWD